MSDLTRVVVLLGRGAVPADTPVLRGDDLGVIRGDGIFETMHVRDGRAWLLDQHLARIISPTLFSVGTNRRLFKGLVHLTEMRGYQRGLKVAVERSRWSLEDRDVESHLGLSYDFMVHLLTQREAEPRKFDPSGEEPLHGAKTIRRRVLDGGTRNRAARLIEAAEEHFGLPTKELAFWPDRARPLPWRAAAQKRPRRLEA